MVLNGLLVSQRLPTIDMKNPVDSLTKVHLCSIRQYLINAYLNYSHLTVLPFSIFFNLPSPQIANKAIKLFTTWKLDLTPHVKEVKETLSKIYEKQVKQISITVQIKVVE